jgi:S1-C subfamily serine protease
MLSASGADKAILNAVAASISVGWSEPIMFTEGGHLSETVLAALDLAEDQEEERVAQAPDSGAGSGSGFFVSASGDVLTNAHVVSGCGSVTVNGNPAAIVGTSDEFDLALLRTPYDEDKAVAVFSPSPARLNADVTVAGYPYAGLLGGLNVTRGAVSSVTGLGGGGSTMQITAPVQSGNSGGPVIAEDGEVVGVVVSKLDAVKVVGATGDLPQNVNFAVRGEIAKLFLFQNGVEPQLGVSDAPQSPVALAELASKFTVFVECSR